MGFYAPFLLALLSGGIMLLFFDKGEEVVFVNRLHSPLLDFVFYYGTSLGNGLLYLAVAAGLLWKNFRHAAIAFVCFALTGVLVQLLKKIVFPEMLRPAVLLADEPLHFVEGVKIFKQYSFPSGHTAMAFSLFCLLSQLMRPRWMSLLFILMALTVGISRIYLVQHFFTDVYFGALLGVGVTSGVWFWFAKNSLLKGWNNLSLSSYFKRT